MSRCKEVFGSHPNFKTSLTESASLHRESCGIIHVVHLPDRPGGSGDHGQRHPRPSQAEIEYPDSDGKPMSDHTLQYKWIVVIREGLAAQYADDRDVFVGANLLWYPVEGKPRIRGAPDVMVAFGRPEGSAGRTSSGSRAGSRPTSSSRSSRRATGPAR